ncbi:MAG: LysM peptidoglycan-binding domain-containing protein [Gammaproteobacteria bacterium]|nr:LysM peptidoglycan-binding domain-containing protein [Gammaproteobacteria bacterium]
MVGLLLSLAGCMTQPPAPEVSGPIEVPETLSKVILPPLKAPAPESERRAQQRAESQRQPQVADTVDAEPPSDLWERLRRGFAFEDYDDPRIDAQLAYYVSHPNYLNRIAVRAEPYLYHIVEELERRDMPLELALLPIVESAFDPYAYSHGRAAGLWQFIPGTARMYGLNQDWWHDERRDVKASTRAALDLLTDLAQDFDGDWLLALAGYNAGPGNVRRALGRNERAGQPLDFFSLPLPRETRAYVPKLLALKRLVNDPAAFDLELQSIANEPHFEVVPVGGQIDLAHAAELAGMDSRELYLLNPALNRWATHPQGPHRLLVPRERAEDLRLGIAAIDPGDRLSWHRHVIRPGESLSIIAKRYGTDVGTLRTLNQLSSSTIRAGDNLLIPKASAPPSAYALSQGQRTAAREARFASDDNRREVRYRVRSGDSFWSIARAHEVSVAEVTRWNGMAPGDTLRVGRELLLWLPQAPNVQPAVASLCADSACALPEREAEVRRVGYRVRSGDSLARIAGRFGVTIAEITEWNGINPARHLQPGQSLVLYVPVTGTL